MSLDIYLYDEEHRVLYLRNCLLYLAATIEVDR